MYISLSHYHRVNREFILERTTRTLAVRYLRRHQVDAANSSLLLKMKCSLRITIGVITGPWFIRNKMASVPLH